MKVEVTGRLWCVGDNIDTDILFPGQFMTVSGASNQAAKVGLSSLDPSLAEISRGDAIVAGTNFGCGSSREYAVQALCEIGVAAVIAKSFARIFFRNAINLALPIIEFHETDQLPHSGPVYIDLNKGVIVDPISGHTFYGHPLPEFLTDIICSGGLMEHLRATIAINKGEQCECPRIC